MKRLRTYRHHRKKMAEINMAPLIDMIFILLIFFLVTTSFVKDSGVAIERPMAQSAETQEKAHMIVEITKTGVIFVEGKPTDIASIRPKMKRFLIDTPGGGIIIVADRESHTGSVIRVMDECRLAGVNQISIAAKKPES